MEKKNSLLKKEIDLLKEELVSKDEMIADLIRTIKQINQTNTTLNTEPIPTDIFENQIN